MKISELVKKLERLQKTEGDCDVAVKIPVELEQARSIEDVKMSEMLDKSYRFVLLTLK